MLFFSLLLVSTFSLSTGEEMPFQNTPANNPAQFLFLSKRDIPSGVLALLIVALELVAIVLL